MSNYKVPAINFVGTIIANVDNNKLSDKEFREFIRNTLPIVEHNQEHSFANQEVVEKIKKYKLFNKINNLIFKENG